MSVRQYYLLRILASSLLALIYTVAATAGLTVLFEFSPWTVLIAVIASAVFYGFFSILNIIKSEKALKQLAVSDPEALAKPLENVFAQLRSATVKHALVYFMFSLPLMGVAIVFANGNESRALWIGVPLFLAGLTLNNIYLRKLKAQKSAGESSN